MFGWLGMKNKWKEKRMNRARLTLVHHWTPALAEMVCEKKARLKVRTIQARVIGRFHTLAFDLASCRQTSAVSLCKKLIVNEALGAFPCRICRRDVHGEH